MLSESNFERGSVTPQIDEATRLEDLKVRDAFTHPETE